MTSRPDLDRFMQTARGFMASKILLLGVEFNVFDRLADRTETAARLAEAEGATVRGMEILLDALVALELLSKRDGAYSNTEAAQRFLVRGAPDSAAHIIGHHNRMYNSWAQLDDIIRHGKTGRERDKATLKDKRSNRDFILGMAEVSADRVGPLLDRLPLASSRRFVDLGGGPAQYACEAARRNPELEVALVDLPLTVDVAKEYIRKRGLEDRVEAIVCDFYRAERLEVGGPADLVLISQVMHAEGPDENRALLKKLASWMSPGGWVFISENMIGDDRTQPAGAAVFAMNMLSGTSRGRTYTEREMHDWLREAGFLPEPAVEVAERTWLIGARYPL